MARKAAGKLGRQRRSVLELAQTLSKLLEASRRRGVSRTTFHEYMQCFQKHSIADTKSLLGCSKG
jgi:hypothetical protein